MLKSRLLGQNILIAVLTAGLLTLGLDNAAAQTGSTTNPSSPGDKEDQSSRTYLRSMIGTWQGEVKNVPYEMSLWYVRKTNYYNFEGQLSGFINFPGTPCWISGQIATPEDRTFYDQHNDIVDNLGLSENDYAKSVSLDFDIPGREIRCAGLGLPKGRNDRLTITLILRPGKPESELAGRALLRETVDQRNTISKGYDFSARRSEPSGTLLALVNERPQSLLFEAPSAGEMELIRSANVTSRTVANEVRPVSCREQYTNAQQALQALGIRSISTHPYDDNTIEFRRYTKDNELSYGRINRDKVPKSYRSMRVATDRASDAKGYCDQGKAALEFLKDYQRGVYAQLDWTTIPATETIRGLRDHYIVDPKGIDILSDPYRHGGTYIISGALREYGSSILFQKDDITRRIGWWPLTQRLTVFDSFKNPIDDRPITDERNGGRELHLTFDKVLSEEYGETILTAEVIEPINNDRDEKSSQPCTIWLGDAKGDEFTCVETSTGGGPYFITGDLDVAKQLYQKLTSQSAAQADAQEALIAKGCAGPDLCDVSGGRYFSAIVESDPVAILKLDAEIAQGYQRNLEDGIKLLEEFYKAFGYDTSVSRHIPALPFVTEAYLYNYKNHYQQCLGKDAVTRSYRHRTAAVAWQDGSGAQVGRQDSVEFETKYVIKPELEKLCDTVCGHSVVSKAGLAISDNLFNDSRYSQLLEGLRGVMTTHSCTDPKIIKFEKGLKTLNAYATVTKGGYIWQRNSD